MSRGTSLNIQKVSDRPGWIIFFDNSINKSGVWGLFWICLSNLIPLSYFIVIWPFEQFNFLLVIVNYHITLQTSNCPSKLEEGQIGLLFHEAKRPLGSSLKMQSHLKLEWTLRRKNHCSPPTCELWKDVLCISNLFIVIHDVGQSKHSHQRLKPTFFSSVSSSGFSSPVTTH